MSLARNPFRKSNPGPIRCPRGTIYQNGQCRPLVMGAAPVASGAGAARARVFFRTAQTTNAARSCSATPWPARAVTG